jgi:hypothetical protein
MQPTACGKKAHTSDFELRAIMIIWVIRVIRVIRVNSDFVLRLENNISAR